MSKIKSKEKIESGLNAFFERGRYRGAPLDQRHSFLENLEAEEISRNNFEMDALIYEASELPKKEWSVLFQIVRQVFVFFPATVILWITSVEWVTITASDPGGPTPWVAYAAMLVTSLATILGIGDLRNPKHLAIPASIIFVGALLGLIFVLLPIDTPRVLGIGGLLYFLPLALMAPFIAKFLVDGMESNNAE